MKILKVYDREDYTEDMPAFEKYAVRGVIVRDGRVAMQKGSAGEYKILGGGIEPNESYADALMREVREESGLLILRDSIREVGEILEIREDLYKKGTRFINHSGYYFCDAALEMTEPQMTASEIAKGYHLVWATPDEIIEGNKAFMQFPWIVRDTEFIRMMRDKEL